MRPYSLGESGSILPRKGIVGDWVNHFSSEDIKFLAAELEKYNLSLSDWN